MTECAGSKREPMLAGVWAIYIAAAQFGYFRLPPPPLGDKEQLYSRSFCPGYNLRVQKGAYFIAATAIAFLALKRKRDIFFAFLALTTFGFDFLLLADVT